MGVDLRGAGDAEHFSVTSWQKVLQLAQVYGWEPAVTKPGRCYDEKGKLVKQMSPNPDEWDGNNYFSNGLQWVTDKDAANIADALERALDDIPDFDTDEKRVKLPPSNPFARLMAEEGLEMSGPNASLTPIQFFSGEAKQRVKDFISFCRAGGFWIG